MLLWYSLDKTMDTMIIMEIMTMMDIIVADFDKEMREADVDENDGGGARFGGHEQNPQ